MNENDTSMTGCSECEACLFRDKVKQNKNTLLIFGLILSFFAGLLVMFLVLFPLIVEKQYKRDYYHQELSPRKEPRIIETYQPTERPLYRI
jgi:hypothetical protein